jgi:hypothetical protein
LGGAWLTKFLKIGDMKKLIFTLVGFILISCSTMETNTIVNGINLVGTSWASGNKAQRSTVTLEFKDHEIALITFWKIVDKKIYIGSGMTETIEQDEMSTYIYMYQVQNDKILFSIYTVEPWVYRGNLYIMPNDRNEKKTLIGQVDIDRMQLLYENGDQHDLMEWSPPDFPYLDPREL